MIRAGFVIVMMRTQSVVIVMMIAQKRLSIIVKYAKNQYVRVTPQNANSVRRILAYIVHKTVKIVVIGSVIATWFTCQILRYKIYALSVIHL